MKILLLGGDGMLGHQLLKSLAGRHDVTSPSRGQFDAGCAYDLARLHNNLETMRPDVVINTIGIVKQRPAAQDPISSIEVNALFPHKLKAVVRDVGARLIHFSTDCVFSGRDFGCYAEIDLPDPEDLYGRTKLLGEVDGEGCLTLRTSIIGRELTRKLGLVEWFLAQQHGTVPGFTRSIFSGLTTIELARVVERVITHNVTACGVWHVGGEAIRKYDLLQLLKRHYGLSTELLPEDSTTCNRSLDSSRFYREFNYKPPTWRQMISELE